MSTASRKGARRINGVALERNPGWWQRQIVRSNAGRRVTIVLAMDIRDVCYDTRQNTTKNETMNTVRYLEFFKNHMHCWHSNRKLADYLRHASITS